MTDNESDKKKIRRLILLAIFMIMLLGPITIAVITGPQKVMSIFGEFGKRNSELPIPSLSRWQAPDINTIPANMEGDAIRYGRALITNTSEYLGPNGKVMAISNGMNCQNCHLEAGTKYLGNNFSAVASTYPKFRARSGSIETIEKRVNDCIERSLNGQALKNDSREMKAMVAYIKWVGSEVPIGQTPSGAGLMDLPYLDIAADPTKGKLIYDAKCSVCHGKSGEGMKTTDNLSWTNPPLWGVNSYNTGAGLYRLSRLAGYVKVNMPFGANADNTQVTDEEAWHVAAFINSMDRPVKDISRDWPDISAKPVDHPFGPFADDFTEKQHKYGPFKPILALRKRKPSR
jgi:thiosulfate dehydrogenase